MISCNCANDYVDHTKQWYMHRAKSVLENETHTIFWKFEIQSDFLIWARRLDLVVKKKFQKEKKAESIFYHSSRTHSGSERKGKCR